jgi:hypothetical protein
MALRRMTLSLWKMVEPSVMYWNIRQDQGFYGGVELVRNLPRIEDDFVIGYIACNRSKMGILNCTRHYLYISTKLWLYTVLLCCSKMLPAFTIAPYPMCY